ncbi:hypothetical protein KM043_015758 [Ampulex compressa]|nr:hypothetical protein KM043_015758 [Ampulex compressa]
MMPRRRYSAIAPDSTAANQKISWGGWRIYMLTTVSAWLTPWSIWQNRLPHAVHTSLSLPRPQKGDRTSSATPGGIRTIFYRLSRDTHEEIREDDGRRIARPTLLQRGRGLPAIHPRMVGPNGDRAPRP